MCEVFLATWTLWFCSSSTSIMVYSGALHSVMYQMYQTVNIEGTNEENITRSTKVSFLENAPITLNMRCI